MFSLRSISARLVLAISLLVVVICGVLGTFSVMQQHTLTQLALDQQLKLQYDSVIAALDYEGRAALAVSGALAALPPVGDAVAKGDRDALMALLGGVHLALKAQGIESTSLHLPPAVAFLRVHEPKTHGDDISARRPTVVRVNQTGTAIVGPEVGRSAIGIYAMSPIMRDGKSLAVVDVGIYLKKEFVDRAKQRFGVDLAVHSFDGTKFNKLSSTFGDGVVATPDELKRSFEGAAVRRAAVLGGHDAALYLGPIKNYAGQPIAVLELVQDTSAYEVVASDAQTNLILGTVVILVVAVLLALLLGRSVSRPVTALTATMNQLSGGDTAVTIPGSERRDELGTMAVAVDVFRRNMIEAEHLAAAQAAEQDVKAQRAASLDVILLQLLPFRSKTDP